MNIIVQKFGGTSVGTKETREMVLERIVEAREQGYSPVVVVSAMGRAGDPYATDTLKSLLEDICPEVPLRELDLVMHCGEIISAAVLAASLHRRNISAKAFTGAQAGLITDENYSQGQVADCNPERIVQALENQETAVVAGFQGVTPENEVCTLGRGGSDITAVILGAALGADFVEIYTDVDGVATADPRLMDGARIIPRISYSEVCQMAYEGARVIHPFAVEIARKNRQNLIIKNLNNRTSGTIIAAEEESEIKDYRVQPRRVVSGIAHTIGLAQVAVELSSPDAALELEVFDQLAQAGVNIDLINVFPTLKVFTVDENMLKRAETVLDKMQVNYKIERECAKVSVIGVGMRNIPGVMARVVKALNEQKIEILQTGDSNITISLLIRTKDLEAAVRTLHEYFQLEHIEEKSILTEQHKQ